MQARLCDVVPASGVLLPGIRATADGQEHKHQADRHTSGHVVGACRFPTAVWWLFFFSLCA